MCHQMQAVFAALWGARSGATAIEYAMIALFIALVLIASLISIGTSVSGFFNSVGTGL